MIMSSSSRDLAVSSSNQSSRTGRKGDPRMHRAVSARIKDPRLTLFDALRIGGFDYPADEDANCVDEERVTLGQRKNQLSRRIRLAKKQLEKRKKRPSKSALADNLSDCDSDHSHQTEDHESNILAKNHPQFQQLQALRAAAGESSSSAVATVVANSLGAHGFGAVNQASLAALLQQSTPLAHGPAAGNSLAHSLNALMVNNAVSANAQTLGMAGMGSVAANPHMTNLEQLALNLQNTNNLGLQNSSALAKGTSQLELALQLYQAEHQSLYQKSMLLAGYQPQQVADNSPQLLEFAMLSWQAEGRRLEKLIVQREQQDAPLARLGQLRANLAAVAAATPATAAPAFACTPVAKEDNANLGVKKCLHPMGSQCAQKPCGHKPVLHQPAGGTAHIDFLVGDKVECYHDSEGILPKAADDPKLLAIDELSFDEFNFDLSDDGLLGLMQLGSDTATAARQHRHQH